MKRKEVILVAILLMVIGFAALSTTLIINGSASVGENTEDFSVIFTKATLDGVDVYNEIIDDTKKTINFSTKELKTLNQTSVLAYEITNNSSNYDAEVQVNCKVKDDATAKYTSIKNELANNATIVKAKATLSGTLTVTLNKTATEEVKEEYVCELTFNAVERDTLGSSGPTYYYAFGTPTTESTTDYTTLGKNVFAVLDTTGTKGLCINDNGLFCIKTNDYDNSVLALKNHFGESTCIDSSDAGFRCTSDAFFCGAYPNGYVHCGDRSTSEYCSMDFDGSVSCS